MKKNTKRQIWIAIGVFVAAVLLLWWLYAATLINEDVNELTWNHTHQIILLG